MNKYKAIIRCDASSYIGYGHLFRCIALAKDLKSEYNFEINFAIKELTNKLEYLLIKNFSEVNQIFNLSSNKYSEDELIKKLIKKNNPSCIIFDIRTPLKKESIDTFKEMGVVVVGIDDASERRLSYDINFYPPVKQLNKLNWEKYIGKLYIGWEYILLRNEFRNLLINKSENNDLRIFLSMGGSDPNSLTILCLEVLMELKQEFSVEIILGPGFKDFKKLLEVLNEVNFKYSIRKNLNSFEMVKILSKSNFAIISYGMTAFECLSVGIPALHISLTSDHYESAKCFSEEKVSINFGFLNNKSAPRLLETLTVILNNKMKLNKMKAKAKKLKKQLSKSLIAKKIFYEIKKSEENF